MIERHFEAVKGYTGPLPKRSTAYSAGYDIAASQEIIITPNTLKLVHTGLKVKLGKYEYLELVSRSSLPIKTGLIMPNGVGIIDSDYYNNKDNEGEIMGQFYNISSHSVVISKGERIMQGIFRSYLITDDDSADGIRTGGFGSTDI